MNKTIDNQLSEVCVLESSNGDFLMIDHKDAKRSLLLKDLLELEEEREHKDENKSFENLMTGEIRLPFKTDILERVILWMESVEIHNIYPEETGNSKTDQQCQTSEKIGCINFREGFFLIPADMVIEIIKAAEYLQLRCLQHAAIHDLSGRMRGMDEKQLGRMLKIDFDWSQQEMSELKDKHAWLA